MDLVHLFDSVRPIGRGVYVETGGQVFLKIRAELLIVIYDHYRVRLAGLVGSLFTDIQFLDEGVHFFLHKTIRKRFIFFGRQGMGCRRKRHADGKHHLRIA